MTTGDDIRDARQRAGLTQAALAEQIGVSMRTVGNWERGETPPDRHAARIRHVLEGLMPSAEKSSIENFSDAALLAEIARRFDATRSSRERTADHARPSADAAPVADPAQRDGATIHPMSPRRPRLLGPDDDDDILEEPYAADTSEDPGEDDQ